MAFEPSPTSLGCPASSADVSASSVSLAVADATSAGATATLEIRASDDSELMPNRGVGYKQGIFEAHETEQCYMLRRRWFQNRTNDGESGHIHESDDILERRSKDQRRLNEFGHSEDTAEYHRRRKWYLESVLAQQRTVCQKEPEDGGRETQRWRVLLQVICIMICALSVWFSANSFLADICEDYGVTKSEGSLLTVLVNIGFCVGATSSGLAQLHDHVPASRLLLVGCLGCAISNALLVTGLPFQALLVARLLNGVAIAFVYPTLMRFVASWFPAKRRGFALGTVLGSLTVAIALPNLLKAALPATPWRGVILGTSVLALVGSGFTCGLSDGPYVAKAPAASCKNVLRVVRSSKWILVTLSYCAHNLELFGGWAWMGAFLESYIDERAGGSAGDSGKATASALAFGVVAVGCLGAPIGGLVADRIGKRRFICSVHIVSGVSIALLPHAAKVLPLPAVAFIAGIWGFTVIADSAQYSALLAEVLTDTGLLGTAIALSLALGFVSTAIGVFIVPLIFDQLGWEGAFACLAVGPFVGTLAILAI
eukprot:TRINITY_DN4130_c0_g3_i1.p1 TRINITY_DN4130_c0_g3~~TRINITY_DN4130_c0_g3_i1.p1  ORF type:complete len:551 (+),score=54.05 TRINITY_DN4130_c0_g3_i1:29-1654(+)